MATRPRTRAIALSTRGSHRYSRWKSYPSLIRPRNHGAKLRLANVVSKAKLSRSRANSRRRVNMILPAAIAIASASNPDSPRAMTSAFTKWRIRRGPVSSLPAIVDFPAPFGPAMMTTRGWAFPVFATTPILSVLFRLQPPDEPIDRRRFSLGVHGVRRVLLHQKLKLLWRTRLFIRRLGGLLAQPRPRQRVDRV